MEGLIFKVQPYLEHARLLFVYTPIGKKTLLAQGSQKVNHPSRILAQYLTHISFKDKDKNKTFITLSEGTIIQDFNRIKQDFDQTKSAALILEILDQIIVDNYPHAIIFKETIIALNAPHIKESSLSFALKILKPLGYELNLIGDGRILKGINIEKGGLIYQGDPDSADLETKDAIHLLKLSFTPFQDIEPLDEASLSKIKNFIFKYYQYHLQTTLKTLQ
ncbi:MAG: DNA repair protein RecO [Acholeplasmataceae bacterium]|nr:DNA repair protein RecO [Acholeplasmataceae bacterium]